MGIIISVTIVSCWSLLLYNSLSSGVVDFSSPVYYLRIALSTFLYTGLFITAHDSMHGTVSRNKRVNDMIGILSTFLFAGFSFNRLKKNHFLHHSNPTGITDPDFCQGSQNFFIWFGRFIYGYSSLFQIAIMAVQFNILIYLFEESNVISFWLIPSLLSSLQLFYFGTYLPHRRPEDGLNAPHYARSQKKNHFLALITCYFFGYHHEHHSSPRTPWWQLYKSVS